MNPEDEEFEFRDDDLNSVRAVSMDQVPCTRDMECFDTRGAPSSGGGRGKEKKSVSQQPQPSQEDGGTSDRDKKETDVEKQSKESESHAESQNNPKDCIQNQPEVEEKAKSCIEQKSEDDDVSPPMELAQADDELTKAEDDRSSQTSNEDWNQFSSPNDYPEKKESRRARRT